MNSIITIDWWLNTDVGGGQETIKILINVGHKILYSIATTIHLGKHHRISGYVGVVFKLSEIMPFYIGISFIEYVQMV